MRNNKLLMIPGPIEFDANVLNAMQQKTSSHVAPSFIETFGNCIDMVKKTWLAPKGQVFIVSGSGTLAMDMAASNLVEQGDNVLVISTGYFGERFENILQRYGAKTTILKAEIGNIVSLETIEKELQTKNYKLLTFTHVDTSTGVMVDPKQIAALAQKYNVLSILDGVCSVAGEEIQQENWGIDVVLTASQKAVGVPPGLALLVASEKAMNSFHNRKTLVSNYYADWTNWLPIMKAYEERRPSYFGTPPVNLIVALEVSLKNIISEGIDNRFSRHQKLANAFRSAIASLGLKTIATNNDIAANTLSAIYYPEGIDGAAFCALMSDNGVIVAGGLLPDLKTKYFRVGHMGSTDEQDMIAVLSSIEYALNKLNYEFKLGTSIKKFQEFIYKS